MDFSVMQSIGNYTKNMEMQMKWKRKKANSDFTADGSTKISDSIARQAEEIRKSQADGSSKLSAQIRTKLATGKKLTQEEMDYLQKHDPQTYQKAKSIEEEQKSYEEELKRCRTKEDVQRVKMNHTAASLSTVNNVKNNPAIPEGAKLGIMWQELMKSRALEETLGEFVKSGRYAQLPTEAEKAEAEKTLKEAKEAELGMEDSAESIEKTDNDEKEVHAEGTPEEIQDDTKKEVSLHESVQRDRAVLQERRITVAEAETTPEALKVKRAKVRAAYKASQAEIPEQVMDLKH
ncbi:hypothetical protein D3Z53_15235 [Lachnospiraceae bacterium]|nr:hypothetical protein [uncultured Schaedlerella sp.]MCI9154870.1 hypothetical protein [Ruminococcus sp.]NBI59384.1 hypothetical protein [Lachnospiraceae bacterium]